MAILHDGTPPYHFRERFIQTWGYEHRPAATGTIESPYEEIAPEDDARYRVPYRRIGAGDSPSVGRAALDLHLLIGLDGRGTIGPVGDGPRDGFGPDDLALVIETGSIVSVRGGW